MYFGHGNGQERVIWQRGTKRCSPGADPENCWGTSPPTDILKEKEGKGKEKAGTYWVQSCIRVKQTIEQHSGEGWLDRTKPDSIYCLLLWCARNAGAPVILNLGWLCRWLCTPRTCGFLKIGAALISGFTNFIPSRAVWNVHIIISVTLWQIIKFVNLWLVCYFCVGSNWMSLIFCLPK